MSTRARAAALLSALALTGCAVPHHTGELPATAAEALPPAQLVNLVQADTDRIEHSKDAAERARLLATATANAQQCVGSAPQSGPCHYVWAQVLGLAARERPVQAVSLLKEMLASLKLADALDPAFDHGGPSRLTAVVLLRAPGWPLGPGDPDGAVLAAQRAVDRDAAYPPNLITLAQALAKTDAAAPARASYEKARAATAAWVGSTPDAATERSEWQREVEQGLHDLQ